MKLRSRLKFIGLLGLVYFFFSFATCKYSTHDTSPIPADIKNFKVEYFENKARYVNPQLTPQITESLKEKIIGETRLTQTNNDDADYDISGYLSEYNVSTTGISGQTASTNRLSVTFHLIFKNNKDNTKNFEADLSSSYDFSAQLTLPQAESGLTSEIVKNITDAIFNRIFSNW
jgi:Lipopolysaccharide-assembly